MKLRILFSAALLLVLAAVAFPQRPRNVSSDPEPEKSSASMPTPAPAPTTFKAKYEGGMFGHSKTMEGTLTFEDINNRLVFRNDKQKEALYIPYASISGAFADTKAVRPAAASAASVVPYIGLPAGFIKTKVRYLTVQYNDQDSNVSGVTSFRVDNKDLLDSVLYALANKSGLTARGEVYVRKKQP